MITILRTTDPAWVVAVGERAVVDVVAVDRLPADWRLRGGPNVLGSGAMGLAQAACALTGLALVWPAQAVQLQERELASGARHPALHRPAVEVPI